MIAYDYTNRRYSCRVGILIRYIKPTHRYEWHVRWRGSMTYRKTSESANTGKIDIPIKKEYLDDSYEYFMLAVEKVFDVIAAKGIEHITNRTENDNPDIVKVKTI